MNDRRSAIAVIVCIMFVLFYTQLFIQPMYDQARLSSVPPRADSNNTNATPNNNLTTSPTSNQANIKTPQDAVLPNTVSTTNNTLSTPYSTPTLEQLAAGRITTIKNSDLTLKINHLGGRFQSVLLSKYKATLNSDRELDLLIGNKDSIHRPGRVSVHGLGSDDLIDYNLVAVQGATLVGSNYKVNESAGNIDQASLIFEGQIAGDQDHKFVKTVTVPQSGYLIGIKVEVSGNVTGPVHLEWSHHLTKDEEVNRLDTKEFEYVALPEGSTTGKFSRIVATSMTSGERQKFSKVKWIGFGGIYFLEAISAKNPVNAAAFRNNESFVSAIEGGQNLLEASLYLGPKSRPILYSAGNELWRAVDLGTFAVVAEPLLWLLNLLYRIFGNYGLAIIGLTLLVKLALYPIAKHSYVSMSKMQELQPEMKKLQELHKLDQTKLQQEMMALYKRKGVNPLGGCLPLFLQIPVFLGLYNGLLKSIELRHESFALWINDLSSPEKLNLFGINIPVMIILMAATMIWQQWTTPSAVDPQQKKIMMMMPVVFAVMFIIFPMPSGLVLYWLVNNIISIIQQNFMRSQTKSNPLFATLVASGLIFGAGFILTLI